MPPKIPYSCDFIISNSEINIWLAVLILVIKVFWQELEMVNLWNKLIGLIFILFIVWLKETLTHYVWDEHVPKCEVYR